MGHQFYSKMKAARDALGLQYRFEMILDTGRDGLKLSPHFMKRVAKRGSIKSSTDSGCYSNGDGSHGDGCHDNHVTYSDLDNLPCIIVITGEERPHVPLPRSVCYLGNLMMTSCDDIM